MPPVERTEALWCDKHEFCLADRDLERRGLTRHHEPTREKHCARQIPDHAPPPIVEARNDTDRVCHIRCRPVDGVSLCQWSDAAEHISRSIASCLAVRFVSNSAKTAADLLI